MTNIKNQFHSCPEKCNFALKVGGRNAFSFMQKNATTLKIPVVPKWWPMTLRVRLVTRSFIYNAFFKLSLSAA